MWGSGDQEGLPEVGFKGWDEGGVGVSKLLGGEGYRSLL